MFRADPWLSPQLPVHMIIGNDSDITSDKKQLRQDLVRLHNLYIQDSVLTNLCISRSKISYDQIPKYTIEKLAKLE